MPNDSNTKAFAAAILELARMDPRITVLCCDSRGSGGLGGFADELPKQFVEVGIAEQNMVAIAAGMASCGRIPFAVSPACFLSMRAAEQVKVDVAYARTNVKLIGISAGVGYGALGATHHSTQDMALMRTLPGMSVHAPSDNAETMDLALHLVSTPGPAYVRLGRLPVDPVPNAGGRVPGKGVLLVPHDRTDPTGLVTDAVIVACGELVQTAVAAGDELLRMGIRVGVAAMNTVSPLDIPFLLDLARGTRAVVTVEEHSVHGGLGEAVAHGLCVNGLPRPMGIMGIPDEHCTMGNQSEIRGDCGLTPEGIVNRVLSLVEKGGGSHGA